VKYEMTKLKAGCLKVKKIVLGKHKFLLLTAKCSLSYSMQSFLASTPLLSLF